LFFHSYPGDIYYRRSEEHNIIKGVLCEESFDILKLYDIMDFIEGPGIFLGEQH
jgi:hypothetical protein